MELSNHIIAITGAARGLGLGMAKVLGKKGATIALIDIQRPEVDQATSALKELGINVFGYTCNVAEEAQVDQTFTQIVADHGQIDGLINNAGILRDSLLLKTRNGQITDRMSLQQWQSVIDVNLTGVFLCGRAAAEQMINNGTKGVIINISSIARNGNIGQSNYAAAKAGVAALATTWAKELARHGIRSAAIAPGFVMTDMVAGMKPEILKKMALQIPVGRLGQIHEIADATVFILTNKYFNGRVLDLDGGLRL